jgi:hypothetical protein
LSSGCHIGITSRRLPADRLTLTLVWLRRGRMAWRGGMTGTTARIWRCFSDRFVDVARKGRACCALCSAAAERLHGAPCRWSHAWYYLVATQVCGFGGLMPTCGCRLSRRFSRLGAAAHHVFDRANVSTALVRARSRGKCVMVLQSSMGATHSTPGCGKMLETATADGVL